MTPVIRIRIVAGRKTNKIALCVNPQTQNGTICVREIGGDLIDFQNLAVRKDEVATRANLVMHARFTLVRAHDNSTLLSTSAISANSYNILSEEFATLSAENDARARAVRELSDEIKTRIAIYLSRVR